MTNDTPTIKIDGVDYAIADLSDEAKGQLTNVRVTDQEIARLQAQLAIAQTARAAYARTLGAALAQVNAGSAAAGSAPAPAAAPAALNGRAAVQGTKH